jgi:hypothetical protein
MKRLTRLLVLPLLLLFAMPSQGQTPAFEGTIEFKQTKGTKVSHYVYYVQGHQVRVEEMGENRNIVDVLLVDTKAKTITLLSPERKSYMTIENIASKKDMTNTKVNVTTEKRKIQGYSCVKWVVSNNDLGSAVTYWVADGGFDFFVDFLATIRRKDNIALFFQQVPAAVGYFPLLGEERKIDGSVPMKLEVIKITKKVLRGNFFNIPADYTKLDN